MVLKRFLFSELEAKLEKIPHDIEKIEFISNEILRCRNAIPKVKHLIRETDPSKIKLEAKTANHKNPLIEYYNSDKQIKRDGTVEFMKSMVEIYCNECNEFIERGEVQLNHYKAKMKSLKTWTECSEHELLSRHKQIEPIIWRKGKETLLKFFELLYKHEFTPKYSDEEILVHFADEKQNPFLISSSIIFKMRWRMSDDCFSIFISELVKRELIDNKHADKVFKLHFENREGQEFKDLAQKRYNAKNYTDTEIEMCKTLDIILAEIFDGIYNK